LPVILSEHLPRGQMRQRRIHSGVIASALPGADLMRSYYVYIMASSTCTLYVGVTNDLERRVFEHKQDLVPGFTRRYAVKRLVYYEDTNDVSVAIAREKQIKGWRRSRKVELIASMNPAWRDLSDGWYGKAEGANAPFSRMDSSLRSE